VTSEFCSTEITLKHHVNHIAITYFYHLHSWKVTLEWSYKAANQPTRLL